MQNKSTKNSQASLHIRFTDALKKICCSGIEYGTSFASDVDDAILVEISFCRAFYVTKIFKQQLKIDLFADQILTQDFRLVTIFCENSFSVIIK